MQRHSSLGDGVTHAFADYTACWDAFGGQHGCVSSHSTAPNQDALGWGGQWGGYTDQETVPYGGYRVPLVLCGLRYYDPSTGRFLTRDPMGMEGGVNLYAYTRNNPVNDSDPMGLTEGWDLLFVGWDVYSVIADEVTGAPQSVKNLDYGALGIDGTLALIPGAPAGPGHFLIAGEKVLLLAAHANRSVQTAQGIYHTGSALVRMAGNGGRGGGAAHAKVQGDIQKAAGGSTEVSFPKARRAADVVDAKGNIHQMGNMRERGGYRPSMRERAAIEDIRKEVGPKVKIIFHDKLGKLPSLINPDLRSGWKAVPKKYRKYP